MIYKIIMDGIEITSNKYRTIIGERNKQILIQSIKIKAIEAYVMD